MDFFIGLRLLFDKAWEVFFKLVEKALIENKPLSGFSRDLKILW